MVVCETYLGSFLVDLIGSSHKSVQHQLSHYPPSIIMSAIDELGLGNDFLQVSE
jgi:hypothetical protein